MSNLFNYNTLQVELFKETRSLKITLKREEYQNAINFEMIFELESIFAWASERMEINSIILTSELDILSCGISYSELLSTPENKIQKYLQKLQKIVYAMFMLPQTIIVDLRKGASGAACELSIGADIRYAHQECSLRFNHIDIGLIPCCGGIGFLGTIIPKSTAKNWILSSDAITASELLQSGFLHKSYLNHDSLINEQLKRISAQSPIARMQAKRCLLESILPELDRALEYENNFAMGAMYSEDWKKSLQSNNNKPNFLAAKEYKEILRSRGKLTGQEV